MPKLNPGVRREVMDYLEDHDATKEERREVWQWVHRGMDIYSNPWLYAWSGGFPMDLLSAMRFDKNLSDWFDSLSPEEREAESGSRSARISDDELMF